MITTPICRWKSVALTDTGLVRLLNEDTFMSRPDIGHWLVADGMGGHEAGDKASQLVTTKLAELELGDNLGLFADLLDKTLTDTNKMLRDLAGNKEKIIGTTVAGLILHQNYFLIYWCGDSRVYLYRDRKLRQLTVDHTFTQQLVEQGKLKQEDVREHPNNNIITRAIGAADEVSIDFETYAAFPNDVYLICSDGLDKELDNDEIQEFLASPVLSLEQKAQNMLQETLQRGGRDNTTIVLVQLDAQDH